MSLLATIGAAAAGGSDAFGKVASSIISARAAEKATQKQIEWERERAKNAHQWEVEDLKAAGLNPILSAGGSGAVTGGISAPIPDTTGIGDAFSSAFETLKAKAETAKTGAEIGNITADTENKNIQKGVLESEEALNKASVGLTSAKEAAEQLENIRRRVKSKNADLEFWNEQINKAANTANQLSGTVGNVLSGLLRGKGSKLKPLKDQFDFYNQGNSTMPML